MERDELTGLRTGRALRGMHGPAVAIWIDIDRVKELCDREGHRAGDVAIRVVAHAIREVAGDEVTHRTAGDEFLIALPGEAIEEAAELAERIRAAVEAKAPLTVTGGVACGADVRDAWDRAQSAAMGAKAVRNTISVAR